MDDEFQKRYLDHQAKKVKQLASKDGEKEFYRFNPVQQGNFFNILGERRSQRIFNRTPIEQEKLDLLAGAIRLCPSSCNRQAISIKDISSRDEKELISGLLVGGVGWCHRADHIFLLFANAQAYKAEGEITYMPYLDAGAMIEQIYLTATVLNLGVSYINPNIRENNKSFFKERYGEEGLIYCGCIVLGYYDKKVKETPKRLAKDIWIEH